MFKQLKTRVCMPIERQQPIFMTNSFFSASNLVKFRLLVLLTLALAALIDEAIVEL